MGDVYRLRQILINLVGNAVKFTRAGTLAIHLTQLPVGGNADALDLKFSIVDTGSGMSPEQVAKLFKPYVQAEASTTRKFGGTGLGLDICKRLTEMMGGKISVESVAGKGSTFSFTIRVGVV